LWPDGIFLTKHPKRRPSAQNSSQNGQSRSNQTILTPEQQLEAARRAKFVHELIIGKTCLACFHILNFQ
jgi:sorting nexin-13